MEVKNTITYIAADGTEFSSQRDCEEYEAKMVALSKQLKVTLNKSLVTVNDLAYAIKDLLSAYDMCLDVDNESGYIVVRTDDLKNHSDFDIL